MAPRSDARTAPPQLAVRGPLAERLDERTPRVVAFDPNAHVETQDDANVVGVLPGTKAGTEEEEFVLLCAHRDHVGTMRVAPGQPEPEDTIFNGADDDASGCAFVLELAEAIAAQPERSPRTLVVTLVTGEEAGGFVGSAHYAAHPAVPLDRTVCALNFEMTGRPDDLVGGAGRLWLTGDDRSDLGPKLRQKGFAIQPDPRPEGNFFVRSDNVSFARVGVVSQTVSSYNMHQDYHRVTDEWDTLDYAHMETGARTSLGMVQSLLAGDWTPSWNEGQPGL